MAEVTRQDLIYRRSDLKAAIAREEQLGRNTGLLHAARRMLKAIDEMLNNA